MQIKPVEACRYDILSLGEVMLRLDPGDSRVRTARQFAAWEGGGEYNVARGLSRCFGMRAAHVTSLADNDVGRLVENLMIAGGVDTSHVQWSTFDGVGRSCRNGLNFTERGFGVRPAKGTSDRGHTAISQLKPGDVDWNALFQELGVRWFHTGGIFAGLSETAPQVIVDALTAARANGTMTSYDLNFRASLWREFGGHERCQQVNREIAPLVDVMIGNEEDFTACLGVEVDGVDEALSELPRDGFARMVNSVQEQYPNFQLVATTLRGVKTATINDWSAICWHAGKVFESRHYSDLEIFDRVGGGDSFASGLIYGLMDLGDVEQALECGVAHGALAMTTPGDTSMASLDEVKSLMEGKSKRVQR